MNRRIVLVLLVWLGALLALPADAHKESDAFLTLTQDPADPQTLVGRWDIALRDLNFAVGIDTDHNGAITWGEVKAHRLSIERYALSRLSLTGDGLGCRLIATGQAIAAHSDGRYDVIEFSAHCAPTIPTTLGIDYRLFADLDPYHRAVVTVHAHDQTAGAVVTPGATATRISLQRPARWQQFASFVHDGMWHIWLGLDHMMFLLSLLLPSVLLWQPRNAGASRQGRWLPVPRLMPALIETVKIVSAFTVSHSLTLTLAVLGVVALRSWLVESGIALSIIVAALNNLFPVIHRRVWVIAFLFGLIHGLGFASALAGLDLPASALIASLGGFNIGVELGQAAIVIVFMPLAFALRRSRFYQSGVMGLGSVLIILVSTGWLIERLFDLSIPFFDAVLPG